MRKWIRPRNFKLLNDSLSMAYVDPTILNTNIEYSKHNEYIGNKNKKLDKLPKKNLKYVFNVLSKINNLCIDKFILKL